MPAFYITLGIILFHIFYPAIIHADTSDVWKAKINDKIIIHSNELEIVAGNPMVINIKNYSDSDTLKIRYFTDTRQDTKLWELMFKDKEGITVFSISNPIDSTIRCYPMPCEAYFIRKSEAEITIKEIKYMLKLYNLNEFDAYIYHSNYMVNRNYNNKTILRIISK